MEISDQGKGIENIAQAMEPFFTTRPDMDRSGLGFSFMEEFMDEVHITSEVGRGTKVTLRKALLREKKQKSYFGWHRKKTSRQLTGW